MKVRFLILKRSNLKLTLQTYMASCNPIKLCCTMLQLITLVFLSPHRPMVKSLGSSIRTGQYSREFLPSAEAEVTMAQ